MKTGNNQPLEKDMLTVSDVARILNVHPNTVRVWSNTRLLKAYRIGYRRDRRFKVEDIETLISTDKGDMA